MCVAIARFPEVPGQREEEFQAWFAWSNDQLREIHGLTGRRLLRAADGTYTALVELRSADTLAAMHTTEVASHVHGRLGEILAGETLATKYEVVVDLAKPGSCCGGGGWQRGHDQSAGITTELQVAGSGPATRCISSRTMICGSWSLVEQCQADHVGVDHLRIGIGRGLTDRGRAGGVSWAMDSSDRQRRSTTRHSPSGRSLGLVRGRALRNGGRRGRSETRRA